MCSLGTTQVFFPMLCHTIYGFCTITRKDRVMRDFRSAVLTLALAESWRQNAQTAPKILAPLPGQISVVRPLTTIEAMMLQDVFGEGDARYKWYGAFAADGTILGMSDDLSQLLQELREHGLQLHYAEGWQ
jgi:hypothetical protein